MTLSQIRRLVLAFIFVCIALLGSLVYLIDRDVKANDELNGYVDVVAFCPVAKNAPAVKQKLIDEGFIVSSSNVVYGVPVPDGFMLVLRADKSVLDSCRATLNVKKLNSKFIENNEALQFSDLFKSEKEAKNKASAIKKNAGVVFTVEKHTKPVKKPCVKLIVSKAPIDKSGDIESMMQEAGFVDINIKKTSAPESN